MQKSPSCPKCSVYYSTKDGRHNKQPLLLDCGHTFCEGCLQRLCKENKTCIICPTCKVETTGDVKSLWPDLYTTGMMVSSQRLLLNQELSKITPSAIMQGMRKKDTTKPENLCRECCKRQANCRCEKCDFIMCMQCFDKIHSTSNMLKQHQAVPVTSVESEMEISPICKEHDGRPIEYFCEDDNTPICSRCVIVGDHKQHSITSMEEKNKAVFADMEPALHTGNKVVKKLRKAERTITALVPDMQSETASVIDEIHLHFQDLHGILQAREKRLFEKVYETYKAGIEPLTVVKEQMQEDMRKLEISIKAAQRVLNNNNEVTLHAKDILDELQRARDIPCVVHEKKLESTEKIRFVPDDALMTTVSGYGNVEGTVSLRAEWHTINEMPEELMMDDAESNGSVTPLDSVSVVSTADTATSEDVLVEEEQEILLDSGSERGIKPVKSKKKAAIIPELHPVPPKARIKSGQDKVYVTHIRNPCHFMVQRCGDEFALKKLSRSMNQWCRSPAASREIPSEVQKDDLLLGRYSCDREWYRVQVKQVFPEDNRNKVKLEVLYLDYGNSEVIGLDSVRKMQKRFMKQPPYVMECTLYDIIPMDKSGAWTVEAIQTFAKMTDGKPMIMIVMKEVNNVLHVDLSKPPDEDIQDDRPISVRDSLVFLELASFISPASSNVVGMPIPKRKYMMPEPVSAGESFGVFVTCCGDPSNFYVQRLGEEADYFNKLMEMMQEQYNIDENHIWSIYCPQIDMICMCKYSGDGTWYRAKVIGLPGHKLVEVQYVDYGNTEVVQHFMLRKILDIFIRLPAQAINCELNDIASKEPGGEYAQDAKRWWAEKVTMKHFLMDVENVVNGKLSVLLNDVSETESYSINTEIVEAGYAVGAKKLSRSSQRSNFISSEESSGSYTSKSERSTMPTGSSTSLSSRSSSRSNTPVPSLGDRSPTKSSSQRKSKYQESSDSSRSSSPRKQEKSKSNKFKSTGLSVDVNKAQTARKEPARETPSSADPESPAMVEVVISHFQSPSDFHVQLASSGDLEVMMEDIQKEYDVSEPQWVSWSEGKYCAAKFPDDGRWYRAKVLKVLHKNLIEVFMVDYGYYSQVGQTQLRPLQKEFLRQMCFAFRCHLADVVPAGDLTKWSITACEFMKDEIKSKRMYIQKKGDAEHQSLPIDLLMEEHIAESALEPSTKDYYSLTEKMINQGLGIPTKRRPVKVERSEEEEQDKTPVVHRVYPYLEYLPPVTPPVGAIINVIPSYVDFDSIIYLQEVISGDRTLERITKRIQEKFMHSGAHKENIPWKVGQACIAHFHLDGMWYRAKIMKLEPPHRVQVLFIDFGNAEVVTTDKLRADVEEFIEVPQQCYKCILNNIQPISKDGKWSVPLLNKVHEMTVTTACCAEVVKKDENDLLSINLTLSDRRDLGTVLHQMGMVIKPNDISDLVLQSEKISRTLEKKNPYKTMTCLPIDQYFPVVVTHVELPNIVYFQHTRQTGSEMDEQTDEINAQLSQLEKMSYDLNQMGPTAPPLPTPKQGLSCCAQFGYDKCWYRALVVEMDNDSGQVLVLYVDYGTSEYVTLDRVRALPQQFVDLPAQAVRLILSEVQSMSPDRKWTKDMLEAIIQSVGSKELIGCLKKSNPAKGELFVVGESAGSALQLAYQPAIDRGVIKSPDESLLYNEALVGDISGQFDDEEEEEEENVTLEDEDVIVEEETEEVEEQIKAIAMETESGTSDTEQNICKNVTARLATATSDKHSNQSLTDSDTGNTGSTDVSMDTGQQKKSHGETASIENINANSAVASLPIK